MRIDFFGLLALSCLGSGALLAQSTTQAALDPHLKAVLHSYASVEPDSSTGKYIGTGSCSARACHGGIDVRTTTKVEQNEYSTWVTSDKHTRAYAVLKEPLGRQISAILKIGPAEKAQRCIVCHVVDAKESEYGKEFDASEGVGCESCHGPASKWLGPHIQPTALHADMVKLGLVDNKNVAVRTEKCLTCHLGAPGLNVDHELIAAGHPDLTFEIDSFDAVEPPHWIEHLPDQKPPADGKSDLPMFGARAWAIGQAVQLQQSMLRIARHAKQGPWPEFSEMDCMTCHHSLTGPLSWRQQALEQPAVLKGHRAGDPPYNLSRYILFKHFAAEIDPGLNDQLNTETAKVSSLVSTMSSNRIEVEETANRTAELAKRMVAEVTSATYDSARTERLMRSITADADAIANDGERTAEQATMTLDSLYIAESRASSPNASTREAINGLYTLVKNPSAYNGPQFAAQLKKVGGTLR